MIRNR